MSARTKKTTTTTTKSTSGGTPARGAASQETPGKSQPAGSSRPPSPTMISRLHEKNELASLNDRLASYIDRVRQLETENSRLTRVIQTHEETVSRESTNIKGTSVLLYLSVLWVWRPTGGVCELDIINNNAYNYVGILNVFGI